MSFLVDCIICECGDEFLSEQEFQKHLENDHETIDKRPAPGTCDGEKFSKDVPQACLESNRNISIKTEEDISNNESNQTVKFPIVLDERSFNIISAIKTDPTEEEQGSVVTIRNEVNQQLTISFDDIFANEMVLSHEEIIENKDSSPVAIKLEIPVSIEQVDFDESYSTEEILGNHISEEDRTYEEPMICALCQKAFANPKSLGIHYARSHKGTQSDKKPSLPKNRICEVCGKAFASVASLTYHQRIHTGERPYSCSYCNKGFTMPLLLQIHVRTHTGERPYQCPHCPKAFSNKAAINRHNRVHTGEKPYACPKCGKTFTQSNSMKLHVKTVHLKEPAPYKSKKRIQAELERNRILHTYVKTVKRAGFKQKKGYMNVYSTLT